ncbi:MAG TPA: antibiotic biosynthesis monooxygenase, partial [Nannocystis sp.]
MIRVVYRWSVVPGQEEAFIAAWRAVTLILRERVEGARGSLLLRDPQAPQELTAVARWTSRDAL